MGEGKTWWPGSDAVDVLGVVALRDSARPGEVVTFTPEDWAALVAESARGMGLTAWPDVCLGWAHD
ncbi:DUF397 domain-containing protein [Kitasatospora sp. NBC_01287]|uniref:DUF397 domain-containing protein n=1 Tax=Kitasatospora sp. NBC_01287 TaxID=2903573 RepID=UPI00225B0244|nr:DUF397 domain-containing protein [Kitasatospora sp. NBC_01287]MCX4746928.1 DUF397 domain-containing protein [Kitasatospora sp. NBC_01287]